MSESNSYYNCIFSKAESVRSKSSMEATGRSSNASEIYSGKTKTMLVVSVARSLTFVILHDIYGITYRRIATRANMSEKAVMKSVAKARMYRFSDPIYNRAYKLINQEL